MQIVLIHGMWSTPAVWQDWVPRLEARGHTVAAPALPEHPPSKPHGNDKTRLGTLGMQSYVDAMAKEVSGLPERPVLIGHSLGGLIAQKLTEMGLARATVLLGAAGPRGVWAVWPRMLPHALPPFLRWGFWRKPFALSQWQSHHLLFNQIPSSDRARLHASLVPESGRAATEIVCWPVLRCPATTIDATRISVPMLSIVGRRDNIVPPAVGRALKRKYSARIEHREKPQHGHWFMGEPGWDALLDECADWLEANA